ncbi:MAG TPA: glycosyltransferase [Acholeplasmataceae bacterium]|nr:glycosyltransferase [Acholeplasmataceae bacterium]
MKKINIAYIVPSLDIGGSEKKVLDLASGLNRNLFKPIIITITKTGKLLGKASEFNIPVYCVNKKSKFDVFVVKRISKILKENSIDIVHVFTSTGKLWGRLAAIKAKTKVIISTEESLFRNTFIDRIIETRLSQKTNLIIPNSNATKLSAINATNIDSNKYKVIYNGIDLKPFINAKKVGSIPKAKDEKIIVCVARLEHRKRQKFLIDAFNLVKHKVNAMLVLVGDGPLYNELKNYIKELDLESRVLLLGSRNDVPSILKEADLFILPSMEEGFGNVIIEAMAAKVCVIASKVGGIPEIITHNENGLLFDVDNINLLSKLIIDVITNDNLRNKIAEKALETVNKFSKENMVNEHEKTYQELLEVGKQI